MNVILCGGAGHMGRVLAGEIASRDDMKLVAVVDKKDAGLSCPVYGDVESVKEQADILVDFSHHSVTRALTRYAVRTHTPILILTTGHTDEERECVLKAAKAVPVFFCGNCSFGVTLFADAAARLGCAFPYASVRICETHRVGKADAPSGTAIMLANAIIERRGFGKIADGGEKERGDIEICSVREGDVAGIHEVVIDTEFQSFTLKHEAHSRRLFAKGAIQAMRFLTGKEKGLFDMKDIIRERMRKATLD